MNPTARGRTLCALSMIRPWMHSSQGSLSGTQTPPPAIDIPSSGRRCLNMTLADVRVTPLKTDPRKVADSDIAAMGSERHLQRISFTVSCPYLHGSSQHHPTFPKLCSDRPPWLYASSPDPDCQEVFQDLCSNHTRDPETQTAHTWPDPLWNWTQDFLSNRPQSFRLHNPFKIPLSTGSVQGWVLSSLPFTPLT